MKGLLLLMVMLTGAGSAQADTLVQLTEPALDGIGLPGRTACVGSAFNSDSSIRGACHTVTSSACSGRGCQPVTTTTTYVAVWDAQGNPLSVTACSVTRHHLPQADQVTYENGFDASDCPAVDFNPTGDTVVIDGQPFYYVATNWNGAELVDSNAAGYLYTP